MKFLKKEIEFYFAKLHKKHMYTRFPYLWPQIKFCGWAYKGDNYTWNFMPISKNRKKRRSIEFDPDKNYSESSVQLQQLVGRHFENLHLGSVKGHFI